ncbi:MAG TPA: carboxypeptidase-like regulatory domain-containing protein [Fodinibius sp.]|nr:carboxypeptidase-like regulatory domain-containing protein [Fodinibius sp.]
MVKRKRWILPSFTIIAFLLLGILDIVHAQTGISGTVTDVQTGEPLPGVNILVKGTTTGISTDANGKYELTVESLQATLVISYIGYQKQEVPIEGRTTIDVALQPKAITGEELVVTALGQEREAKELTYSTQNIGSEELSDVQPLNVTSSLSGRVAGISISESSTGLGGDSRFGPAAVGTDFASAHRGSA